ncbi:adenine phosphoribosyltransferase [Flavobacteriaceae bacterium]|nr:adenine phosphoribosyltransferase [Flavobacteriaceae bacterium]
MNLELIDKVKSVIRDVPDFPKPGILFKDITPLFLQPTLVKDVVDAMALQFQNKTIDAVAGIESRGYLFGVLLAQKLNVPFVLIRKAGKLPAKTISESYDLEYGSATIEIHEDAITPGMNVLIHDDLLATGGTAKAAANLVLKKGNIAGFSFFINLSFLPGAQVLSSISTNIKSLIDY